MLATRTSPLDAFGDPRKIRERDRIAAIRFGRGQPNDQMLADISFCFEHRPSERPPTAPNEVDAMTDERLLSLLVFRLGAGLLDHCACGCSEVGILPTTEKTVMPHFVCEGCGSLYAFNGFIILRCLRSDHIMQIDDEPGGLTRKQWEKVIEEFRNELNSSLRVGVATEEPTADETGPSQGASPRL
jgi:hypothetical protein